MTILFHSGSSIINHLIPRRILFADPQRSLVKISPNGKWVSFLARHEDKLTIWVAPLNHLTEAKPLVLEPSVRDYLWAASSTRLLFLNDHLGDENWQLWGVELASGEVQRYTEPGMQAKIIKVSLKHPDKMVIGLNKRDPHYHDGYQLDLASGTLTYIYENTEYWDFWADEDLKVQIGAKVGKKKGEYIDLSHTHPNSLWQVSYHDLCSAYFYPRLRLGLTVSSEQFILIESQSQDTCALIALDRKTKAITVLGHQHKADVADVLLDPQTQYPIAYAVNYERKKWFGLSDLLSREFAYLSLLDSGDMDILSQTANNETWIVAFVHDNHPVTFYEYHRPTQTATYLFNSHSDWKNQTFVPMHPHVLRMRDGLECVSYLSLPEIQQPVPLVLLVHGGPNYRDFWGFNPIHQWLANRGYAVLSVNYRASTGFGRAHSEAGNGEWAGKIHDDLLDAVQWAIGEGIVLPNKVAIMGGSFGGYATLVALTMTPEVFCCGVDLVGPSNLESMLLHFPPYWKARLTAIFEMMLGCDASSEEGKAYMKARSPLYYVDNIQKPLLIGHGANDVRVSQSESDQLVQAMQAKGIPVTYAVFPDEGHRLVRPGNRMAFYALAEAFLAKQLGGNYEPFDDNVPTSLVLQVDDFQLV